MFMCYNGGVCRRDTVNGIEVAVNPGEVVCEGSGCPINADDMEHESNNTDDDSGKGSDVGEGLDEETTNVCQTAVRTRYI